jgi:hypothetical protein
MSVMVRRTLTYGVLTALVTGAYLLLIWIVNTLVQGIPLSQTGVFPVLFGLGVLFLLNPLRARVQPVLDRAFFRTRYNFRQTIQTLSQDLTALLDLDEIAQRLVTTVTRALNVASASSSLNFGVESFQFHAGIFNAELPVDPALFGIRLVRPGCNCSLQFG